MHAARLVLITVLLGCLLLPTTTGACQHAPSAACRTASSHAAQLFLDNHLKPVFLRSRLLWLWEGFPALKAEFGAPDRTTAFELCVYDFRRRTPVLRYDLVIPADRTCRGTPCWVSTPMGWAYHDPDGQPSGIVHVFFEGNEFGLGQMAVIGASPNLPPFGLPLAKDPEVVVQLNSSNGLCWSTHFLKAARNNRGQFMARSE
jgi:hypothetical protein